MELTPELLQRAREETSRHFEHQRQIDDQFHLGVIEGGDGAEDGNILSRTLQAIGSGAARAGFETYDFVRGLGGGGEPQESDKSDLRRHFEATGRALANKSIGYGLTEGVTQFSVGLIGLGKLTKPLQAAAGAGKIARGAYEIGRGAAAGAIVLDPHEDRLSNLIQEFPALENPVSEYLSASPEDSAAEGRLKNALEGIGLDLAVVGIFAGSLKTLKLARGGHDAEAVKEAKRVAALEQARSANAQAFGLPGTAVPEARSAEDILHATRLEDARLRNVQEFGLPEDGPALETRQEANARLAGEEAEGYARRNREAYGLPEEPSRGADTSRPQPTAERPTLTSEAPSAPSESPGVSPEVQPPGPATQLDEVIIQDKNITSAKAAVGAGKAKVPKPSMDVSEFDIGRALDRTIDDLVAIQKHGGREEAKAAGYKFADALSLPWQKLRATTQVRSFVDNMATQLEGQFMARKGGDVLSDRRVQQMVAQRAAVFNEEPEVAMGMLIQAGDRAKRMVADMEASYLISSKMFQDAYQLAFRLKNGLEQDSEFAMNELKARVAAASEVLAQAKSMTAAAGRSLRRMRTEFQVRPEDIESLATVDGSKLVDLLYATKGDAKKLAQVGTPSFMRRVMDEVQFSFTNSLLWMYPTHVVNTTTNLYMLLARPAEKAFGSLMQGAKGSGIRSQAMKEYYYTLTALSDGWEAAVEAFKRGDSVMTPHRAEYFEGGAGAGASSGAIQWRPLRDPMDLAANAIMAYRLTVGMPTRALGAMDEFIKTLRYRAVVQAQAAVEASSKGLRGEELKAYVERKLGEAFDEAGRAVNPAAVQEALTTTFQQELVPGTLGAGFRNLRANDKSGLIGLVLPFIKTPVNVLRYGVKMSPGLNLLQTEYRQMLSGVRGAEAQAHAIGQMTLGAMFMGLAAALAEGGVLTGSGPTDQRLKKQLIDKGWKPYSVKVGNEDGSTSYMPLGRFDPVAMPFTLVADLVEAMKTNPGTRETEAGATAVLVSLAQSFSEKTFLLSLNQALRALTDPDKNAAKYLGQMAGNAIPGSSALKGYANQDPYLREARGFVDNMMKGLPGYSETLPPQRDVFGEPLWRRIGLTSNEDLDEVESELKRIELDTGMGIYPPAPSRGGADLRDVRLEDGRNAYDKLQEYSSEAPGGKTLKGELLKLIRSDAYQRMPDGESGVRGTKLWAFSGVVQKFREAAYARLLAESEVLRKTVLQKQEDARSAFIRNKSQPAERPGETLLRSLGY